MSLPQGSGATRVWASDWELHRRELREIFDHSWFFLGHEGQIQEPGDFVTSRIGHHPILLTRNAEGVVQAFINACRHSGYRVCTEDRGNASQFLCGLHGWLYDLNGRLVDMPGFSQPYYTSLGWEAWSLTPLAQLASYRGLLFGALDPQAPPLPDALGGARGSLDSLLDRRADDPALATDIYKWTIRCNWKIGAEALGDGDFILLPNVSVARDPSALHVWHPVSPSTTEVWVYLLTGSQTSDEIKREMIAHDHQLSYAMGFEHDL